MKTASLLKIFIVIGIIYLLILLSGNEYTAWFLKPILLPSLLFAVVASEKFPSKKILLSALAFSWFGDVVLMFADKGDSSVSEQAKQIYFIIGLVLFLIAHILYIFLFAKQEKANAKSQPLWFYLGVLCIIGYLFAMLFVLYPTLADLKIPVTVYAVVISTMLLMTVKGFFEWREPANYYILAGAICFITSDSLLAFDKFYQPIPLAAFNIMSTYLTAQFGITFGILVLNKKQHPVLSENAAI